MMYVCMYVYMHVFYIDVIDWISSCKESVNLFGVCMSCVHEYEVYVMCV